MSESSPSVWSFFTCHKLEGKSEEFRCRGWLAKHEKKEQEFEEGGFLKKRTTTHTDYLWSFNGRYTEDELRDLRERFGEDAIEISTDE